MLVSSRGIGGIETCDLVVDGSGNAVDCSSWEIFSTLLVGIHWPRARVLILQLGNQQR